MQTREFQQNHRVDEWQMRFCVTSVSEDPRQRWGSDIDGHSDHEDLARQGPPRCYAQFTNISITWKENESVCGVRIFTSNFAHDSTPWFADAYQQWPLNINTSRLPPRLHPQAPYKNYSRTSPSSWGLDSKVGSRMTDSSIHVRV